MADTKMLLLSVLYVVLAMVLVSLTGTYKLTYGIFGKMLGANSQADYGMGLVLKKPGVILHIVVFALLVAIPMFLCKK